MRGSFNMAKKTTVKKATKTSAMKQEKIAGESTGRLHKVRRAALKPYKVVRHRVSRLLTRRPHRSFRLTRRRDYKRSLKLPGYWAFTSGVVQTLWKSKKLFGGLILVYIIVTVAISGFGAQDAYSNLADTLKSSSGDLFKGNFGAVGSAGLLLLTSVTTGLSPNITQAQSVLGGLAAFFGWLATVWLLRNVLAGHKPNLRDGLYNSGSPVLATVLVGFIITVQLLPSAVALIIYTAAQNSGLLEVGVSAMLVWMSVIVLGLLSIYWLSSSLIALVIVTLPGMYPMRAIRVAGDLVIGRRLRVLYRLLWLALVTVMTWLVVMIPIILFDDWVKKLVPSISWLPLVPLTIVVMSSVTLVYVASYVYVLYRRIVDDDAGPA
jgi:hypothetical protein